MLANGSAFLTAISGGVDISEVPGYHVMTDEFSVVPKITSRIGVS